MHERSMFLRIETQLSNLSSKLQSLGKYILANRHQVAFLTIRQLASAAEVSEATITRFVNYFGYGGYTDFLAEARNLVASQLPSTLTQELDPRAADLEFIYNRLCALSSRLTTDNDFLCLANQVASAAAIYIFSTQAAHADAYRFWWNLSRVRNRVDLAAQDPALAEEQITALPAGALAIALLTDHSNLEIVALAKLAKNYHIPLYTICHRPSSALADVCEKYIVLDNCFGDRNLLMPLALSYLVDLIRPACELSQQEHQARIRELDLNRRPLAERPDTLQLAVGHDIMSLDPIDPYNLMREPVLMRCIYRGLVRFKDGSYELEPDLATNWQVSEDGLEVIFYLKRGVMFQGGYGELTSQDVKFSFERQARRSNTSDSYHPAWKFLQEVVALSPYVAKLVLKRPCPQLFTSILAQADGLIFSQKALSQIGQSQHALNPIGAGPYEVKSFRPRDAIELEAYDGYQGSPPLTKRLIFRLKSHAFNYLYSFAKGRLDVSFFHRVDQQVLNNDPSLISHQAQGLQYWWLGMVVTKPPFDRLEARKAVSMALDRDKILDIGFSGAKKLNALIPEGVPGFWGAAENCDYNPAKAREALRRAGVNPGLLMLAADPTEIDIAALEVIRANLVDIGFEIELELCNRQVMLHRISAYDYHLYVAYYTALPDAYPTLNWFTKNQYYNLSQWHNEKYDRLIKEIPMATNDDQRNELIIRAQKIINDDCWCVWLAQGRNYVVHKDYVDIGTLQPDGFPLPWTMSKKL